MNISFESIKEKAAALHFKSQAFINGQYTAAQSGKTFDCLNPANGAVLAKVAECDEQDVNAAVKCARESFVKGTWSERSPSERKQVLLKLADLIEKNQFSLAILETLDTGKPIRDSLQIDIPSAVHCVRWYAEVIDKVYGQIAPTAESVLALITREPLGVVGVVTPWNFPLYLACAKIAPALAAGNSIVIKPAEQAPLSTIFIAELAMDAGLPAGVLNVVPGFGEPAGKAIGLHPDIDGVSFTGSTEVGKLFLKYSAESNMKRVFLECGGKSPNIVFADCLDLEKAATESANGVFFNQGEVCCAPTRLLVQQDIYAPFVEKLIATGKKFQPANPLDPATLMGAIIDKHQTQQIMDYIQHGKKDGAEVILGGQQVHQDTGGNYIEPTIFHQVNNAMKIAREEVFGPVLSVIAFNTMEEAIKIANDTHYGLAASVWTQNINKAHKMARALRVGVVSVNCINSGDVTTPFGGYKQSGVGRESSMQAFDHYTETKTTWIELS